MNHQDHQEVQDYEFNRNIWIKWYQADPVDGTSGSSGTSGSESGSAGIKWIHPVEEQVEHLDQVVF
jgi:hypothetical protein